MGRGGATGSGGATGHGGAARRTGGSGGGAGPGGAGAEGGWAPGGIPLRLAYRGPYAAAEILDFLQARAVPGVEEVRGPRGGRTYRRTLRLAHGSGIAEVDEPAGPSGRRRPPAGLVCPATRGTDGGWLECRLRLADLCVRPGVGLAASGAFRSPHVLPPEVVPPLEMHPSPEAHPSPEMHPTVRALAGRAGWCRGQTGRVTPQPATTAPAHAPTTSRQANSSISTLRPMARMAVRVEAQASPWLPSRTRSSR